MRLVFHGGAGEVGRSCVEIDTGSKRLLLDCGLKLSPEGTEYPIGLDRPEDIDAVFISHAHLDHTGALPLFDHRGMDCPIFATKTTKDLTRLLLKDTLKIGKINHQHLEYDALDIKKVMNCMRRVVIDQKGNYDGIGYEFFDAGHIPGAASVFLDIEGTKILYTGDINTTDTQLHQAAETDLPEIDIMISESTYGDREHPDRQKTEQAFLDKVQETVDNNGFVIIPVFAIGRAQEILLLLAQRKWRVPVFFDGMGVTASDIALTNPNSIRSAGALKQALKKTRIIRRANDRKDAIRKQSIIVTTSGMMTGGPVLHYLKFFHNDPSSAVILTGYQAEDTNGRLLLETGSLFIDGNRKRIKCDVSQFDFSAHSGLSQLKALVRKLAPKKVIWMHGETQSIKNLDEWARALDMESYAPKLGDVIEV